jgi:hypothetical protein
MNARFMNTLTVRAAGPEDEPGTRLHEVVMKKDFT